LASEIEIERRVKTRGKRLTRKERELGDVAGCDCFEKGSGETVLRGFRRIELSNEGSRVVRL